MPLLQNCRRTHPAGTQLATAGGHVDRGKVKDGAKPKRHVRVDNHDRVHLTAATGSLRVNHELQAALGVLERALFSANDGLSC